MLPLGGLRVVEYGRTSMASYCARLLADAGAQVIKVEPPEGDPARRRGPFPDDLSHPERSGLFVALNVNKQGLCLDLKQAEGRDSFAQLLGRAEILVTDLSPLEARRLELTWRQLHRVHPHLIVTSITPFGESGPYRNYHANEHVVYNMGGLAYATPGAPDHVDDPRREPPLRPSTPIAEFIAGAVGATATLLACLASRQDGQGRHVEVSAQEAVAAMLYRDVLQYSYIRLITGRRPITMALMPNAVMPCKDGYVILAVPYGHMWKPFAEILGNPDWAEWEVFKDAISRSVNWDALYPLLLEWTMQFTGEEIMRMAQSKGIPCFRAFTVAQVVSSRHEEERAYFWQVPVKGGKGVKVPGTPFAFSKTPLRLRYAAPRLGQHNGEVLEQLARGAAPWGYWREPDQSSKPASSRLPLQGVRVVDFGQVVSIPFATQLLAWMGAEVNLIETHGRLLSRGSPPYAYGRHSPNTAGPFNLLGTNKRSITLNLTTPQGGSLARQLVQQADVVVENFTTGTMEKMGLGYEQLRQLRPDLIMLSLSGFGRRGEMSSYAAMHSGANVVSGLASITGHPGGRPRIMGSILPDPLAGIFSCLAILEALHYRKRTGQGQYIDLSMSEVLTHLMPEALFDYMVNGREPHFLGNRDRVEAPQGIYPCQGWDAWVGISVASQAEWLALCRALRRADLAGDPALNTAQGRQAAHDRLDEIIIGWTRRHTKEQAVRLLQQAGVPAGASFTSKDMLNDPHLKSRGFVLRVTHPEAGRRRMLGVPWQISDLAPVTIRHAPLLGQYTAEILQELLGILPQELQQLAETKVTY